MKRTVLRVLAAATLLLATAPQSVAQTRRPVTAQGGIVVSDHHLATAVGRDVLAAGGNAIDAAIATAFALAVVHPAAGNIGGGGFLLYHGADGEVTSFNFREKAPLAATETMYLDDDGSVRDRSNHVGPLSVGVPGTVAGLWLAHERLGTLEWHRLVEPAVELARDGFPISWELMPFFERLTQWDQAWYEESKRVFLDDGELPTPGELLKQPDLAGTLERIRDRGRDGFYSGETARLIAGYMEAQGGLITEEDLARYEAVELEPVHGTYRGYDVYSMGPPSSGGIALVEMLNILEGLDPAGLGHNSAAYLHALAESMRRAYADRAEHLGDPDFNPEMPRARLLSKEHATSLRQSIDPERASASMPTRFSAAYLNAVESEETTHFSIVDAAGNAVSLTYTLEFGYGSHMVVAGAGFLLNNEMGDFNAVPGETNERGRIGTAPNLIAPEKRMLSSMTPTIVARDGRPYLLVGSPGGRMIPNTVLQVILNVVDHEMNIAEAVAAPRVHHQWLPDELVVERFWISPDTRTLLESRGHSLKLRESAIGRVHSIRIDPDTGRRFAAADPRAPNAAALGD